MRRKEKNSRGNRFQRIRICLDNGFVEEISCLDESKIPVAGVRRMESENSDGDVTLISGFSI